LRKNIRQLLLSSHIKKILPLFLFSCVYYNTFYNAEVNYKKAEKIIEETPKTDSEDKKIPSQAKKLLGQAIENSNIVINSYPDSKYVDDAYFIIGKASFLRAEFFNAEKYLKKLIELYPDSEYYEESQAWLVYTYLKMGDLTLAKARIDALESSDNNKNEFLINNILAEISIEDGAPLKAYDYYNRCVNIAREKSQKASVYLKLLNISKEYNHLDSAVIYLKKISDYTSGQTRKEAKLDWIKYSRKTGQFEDLLVEIDIMLTDSEYSNIYIKLELERAKIYLDQNDFESAKIYLTELSDNYSRKSESAEALYHLGNIALIENFDLDLALEYFEKSKKDRKSSLYGKRSRDMINRINEYKNLNQELDYILKKDLEQTEEDVEIETEQFEKSMSKKMMPKPKESKVIEPDSLLFVISEKLLFDFDRLDAAKNSYIRLLNDYPNSKFSPQALYVLNFYFPEEGWEDILKSEYPGSQFNLNRDEGSLLENDNIEFLRDEIWSICDSSYNLCAEQFLELYDKRDDYSSLYYYSFINDTYLNNIERAINGYKKYTEFESNLEYSNQATARLNEIKNNIYSSIELANQKINYYYALESLQSGEDLDSVLTKIDKTIEGSFSNYKSSAQLIKSKLNKLISLKNQVASISVDSSRLNLSLDSLYLTVGKIYQLDFMMNDSAIIYFETVANKFEDSKFRYESIKALDDIDSLNNWINYLTIEYPDSIHLSDSSYKEVDIINEIYEESFIDNEINILEKLNTFSNLFIVLGCKDPLAINYDSLVTDDDGSCIYTEETIIEGCTDPKANNYFPDAKQDDGSCIYNNIKLDTLNKVLEINE